MSFFLPAQHYIANFEAHGYTRKDFAYGMTLEVSLVTCA